MTVNYNTHGELSEGARSELTEASGIAQNEVAAFTCLFSSKQNVQLILNNVTSSVDETQR